jgi:hypothetical protein
MAVKFFIPVRTGLEERLMSTGYGQVAGFCEQGNGYSGSEKCREFLA